MPIYNIIVFIVQLIMIIFLGVIIYWINKIERLNALSKRLTKYTLNSDKKGISLYDKFVGYYKKMINKLNKKIYKVKLLKRISQRHCTDPDRINTVEVMSYMSTKILCGFMVMLLTTLNLLIIYYKFTIFNMFLWFTLGYFLPNIITIISDLLYKNKKETDLYRAISIMNNSFKSGKSIIQAIRIVSEEIDEPLKTEFRKMYTDLNYGLNIENSFERFSNRTQLEEAKYIAASLVILNKTGGNITKVFSSIERNLNNNKRIREELSNSTSVSKLMSIILILMPILFIMTIYILDPVYFNPLFKSMSGYLIVIIMLLLYIVYILIVKKTIRVKEY